MRDNKYSYNEFAGGRRTFFLCWTRLSDCLEQSGTTCIRGISDLETRFVPYGGKNEKGSSGIPKH